MFTESKQISDDGFIAPACDLEIELLYQDEHLLVVNKPTGLLSLSGKNTLNMDSVHYRLRQDYPAVAMVHRLDFGTSGLMVLALDRSVNAHLTKQFQSRRIVKRYIALLSGHVAENEGVIKMPIAKGDFPRQKICYNTGKEAISHYRVIERYVDSQADCKLTKLLYSPKTGRTHQLRIHSQQIGHSIIGCDLYPSTLNGVDTKSLSKRLCLHAHYLEFEHPIHGGTMRYNSDAGF